MCNKFPSNLRAFEDIMHVVLSQTIVLYNFGHFTISVLTKITHQLEQAADVVYMRHIVKNADSVFEK